MFNQMFAPFLSQQSLDPPLPVLPKQKQECQELLHARSGPSHRLSCLYASSVTSLLDDVHPS